jgi:hypothetical protein
MPVAAKGPVNANVLPIRMGGLACEKVSPLMHNNSAEIMIDLSAANLTRMSKPKIRILLSLFKKMIRDLQLKKHLQMNFDPLERHDS